MRGVVTQSPQSFYMPSKIFLRPCRSDVLSQENLLSFSDLRVNPSRFPRISLRCNGIGDSGGNVCKTMLDAFFLGKALGEAINYRIQSSMGEFFSLIGGLQADFLKQTQEFQEDVLEKASRAREEAMSEAKDGIELVSKSIEGGISVFGGVASTASTAVSSAMDNVIATASTAAGDVTATASSAIDAAESMVKRSADQFPKPGNGDPKS